MGKHEQPSPGPPERRGFWGTLRFVLAQPLTFTLGLLAVAILCAILAIEAENAYGKIWGAVIGTMLAPLVVARLIRARMNKRDRR